MAASTRGGKDWVVGREQLEVRAEHCKAFFESLCKRPFAFVRFARDSLRRFNCRLVSWGAVMVRQRFWPLAGVLDLPSA